MLSSQPDPIILHQHPDQLEISQELRDFMLAWNFASLHVMLNRYSAAQLLNRAGFSYHCLTEVYDLLAEHGCEGLLRE